MLGSDRSAAAQGRCGAWVQGQCRRGQREARTGVRLGGSALACAPDVVVLGCDRSASVWERGGGVAREARETWE